MATQQQRITAVVQAIGADIKSILANQGALANLTTADKTNLVAAINELKAAISGASGINDGTTSSSATWSSNKINSAINSAVSALVSNSPTTLDTLKELANALGNDENFSTTVANKLGKRVAVDAAQTFTVTEQKQACENIGIGNPDTDFVTLYNSSKA